MILEKIQHQNDIKKLNKEEMEQLSMEIRTFLIQSISETGGHLASNLGVVELTMALHRSFDLPQDKIIWDVGHQSYTHKILTGRKDGFEQLRKFGGMSGFPKRKESPCDAFDTGHSSTSISAGLGYVAARDIEKKNYKVISVIGDGSLTGGMAYEALNNAGRLKTNFIIVLNDNEMSISKNVGGISKYLSGIRTDSKYLELKLNVFNTLSKLPVCGESLIKQIRKTKSGIKQLLLNGMFFEEMGVTYLGPVDGHDMSAMKEAFEEAKRVQGAVIVHVKTTKGKGYQPAEQNPSRFHGAEPFVLATGKPKNAKHQTTYTDVFSAAMQKLGEQYPNLMAITAAMPDGTGLKKFQKKFPKRFFDVGIAEQHAVTFAAGAAAGGMLPVVAVYSSFLQRAYDQLIHDVCIQNLHVVIAVDRAGLVGSDGETHQGIFDLSFLSSIPNMTVMAPKNGWELTQMTAFAVRFNGPIAVRYPRGAAYEGLEEWKAPIVCGKSEILYDEEGILLLAVGSMVETAYKVRARLRDMGYPCSLVNVRFVKPQDEVLLEKLAREHELIVTLEENVLSGGFGQQVLSFLSKKNCLKKVISVALPDDYIEHGNVEELKKEIGLDADSITKRILNDAISMFRSKE